MKVKAKSSTPCIYSHSNNENITANDSKTNNLPNKKDKSKIKLSKPNNLANKVNVNEKSKNELKKYKSQNSKQNPILKRKIPDFPHLGNLVPNNI